MLKPEALQAHVAAGQRFLFHVTSARNVEAIKREGLRPGSELGKSTRNDFFKTRPGHVYLIRQLDLPIVEVGPEPRVFRVDLAQLDPDLVDPDEDMVSEKFPGAVQGTAPKRECDDHGKELPGQQGKLAEWADSIPNFDSTALAERSLEHGRVSYRGTIPPSALELIDTPSPSLAAFLKRLPETARGDPRELAPAGDWRVEVARARALVGTTAKRICAALGHAVEIRVNDVYKCQETWTALHPVIRSLYAEGRLEAGNAVRSARQAIELAEDLGDLPFPLEQLSTAMDVAGAAAEVIGEAAKVPELTDSDAVAIAKDAFAGAHAISA